MHPDCTFYDKNMTRSSHTSWKISTGLSTFN